ncbi:MAG: MFS transporter [Candidatus Binatia bacterium]|nr:MFS transporter [Candidatus Binatia bacterium]
MDRAPRDGPTPTRVRFVVVGLALSVMGVAYLDRVCIAVAAPSIRADIHLTDTELGYVFSAFTFAYALFEIPGGWLADRFGARLMMARIVIWWSVMTMLTGAAVGFWSLVAVRFLFGVGEAGLLPTLARAFRQWLPPTEAGRAFGLTVMAGAIAGALSQPLVATMLTVMSWRWSFAVFGAIGILWVVVWLGLFYEHPSEHPRVNRAELAWIGAQTTQAPPHSFTWATLWNRNVAVLCAMYFLVIYGWYFFLTWLPTYLMEERGFRFVEAGYLAALPLLCIAVGVASGGWASDAAARRWGERWGRRLPALLGLPLAAVGTITGVWSASPWIAALALSLAAGFAALCVAPAWAVCSAVGGKHAGSVTGAMNMFGNLGGALNSVAVGWSRDTFGSWSVPLLSMAIAYLIAMGLWLGVNAPEHRTR